jgi:uncharacterized protein (UPF0276 family)
MTQEFGLAGTGIGWRPEIAGFFDGLPGLGFTEVIAESLHHGVPPALASLRDRGVRIVPHGVRLSLGGADPVDPQRIAQLARAAEAVNAPLVSEHIAFVRAGGLEAGHLLPVPRTKEAVEAIVANVKLTQAQLPVPLALEPIAALFSWPGAELTEGEFLTEILDRTGAFLLLDVANVYANALNEGVDPVSYLDGWPLGRAVYGHVAGGNQADGFYQDTHTHPVPAGVLGLIVKLREQGKLPPALLLERDGGYPPAAELRAELDAIAHAAGFGPVT